MAPRKGGGPRRNIGPGAVCSVCAGFQGCISVVRVAGVRQCGGGMCGRGGRGAMCVAVWHVSGFQMVHQCGLCVRPVFSHLRSLPSLTVSSSSHPVRHLSS